MRSTKTFEQRFLSHVSKQASGCWIWTGAKLCNGYGRVRDANMKPLLAHRASYEHYVGSIPAGKYVCHKCDTPSCVNPVHLFVGTPTENQQDAKQKGRAKKATFKLDKSKVEIIKNLLNEGVSQSKIANQFCISQSMVSNINTQKGWANV